MVLILGHGDLNHPRRDADADATKETSGTVHQSPWECLTDGCASGRRRNGRPKSRWERVGVLRTRSSERSYAVVSYKQARQLDRPKEKRATKSSRGKAEMKNKDPKRLKRSEHELERISSSKVRMLLPLPSRDLVTCGQFTDPANR